MFSRLLTNIILLVIVITLGMFIYVSRDDTVVDTNLTTLDANSITQISISHKGREVALEKKDDHWRMLKPTDIDASDFRIKTLLGMLTTQSFASYEAAELDMKKIGLDAPTTSIHFDQTGIDFGIVNPISHNRYVLVNGRVHLISDQFYPLLSSQIGTLVSPNLLPRGALITGIDLPEQTLRKSDIGWQSSDTSISTDDIQKTVDQWGRAQAFGVHTYHLRKSQGHIEVSIDSQDKPLVFEVTDTDPWLIIARPDLNMEYHFNHEFIDRLLHPGADEPVPDDVIEDTPAPAAVGK
jgi:hypothetical protein